MPPKNAAQDASNAAELELLALMFAAHPDLKLDLRKMATFSTTLTSSAIEHRFRKHRAQGRELVQQKDNTVNPSAYDEERKKGPTRGTGSAKEKRARGDDVGVSKDDPDGEEGMANVKIENPPSVTPSKRGPSNASDHGTPTKKPKRGVARKLGSKKPEKIDIDVDEENAFINDGEDDV